MLDAKEYGLMSRQYVFSGSPWETSVGYSRAVRQGQHIFVSGTTSTNPDGSVSGIGSAYEQTKLIFAKIESALKECSATFEDVTRTRMFVTDISRWEEFGRAHGEVFAGENKPAATMVEVARLIDPNHLIEIEVDAIVKE